MGAHGYLPRSIFFWEGHQSGAPTKYGGSPGEIAGRFLSAELIAACRAEVGPEFAIYLCAWSQWKAAGTTQARAGDY